MTKTFKKVNEEIWKKIDPVAYFSNINIPDNWDNLEDFVNWYIESRMPLMVPWNAGSIVSDDAAAICIFRKGNYQVEFYLEFPQMSIRKHAHPRMEVIVMELGGGSLIPSTGQGISNNWGNLTKKLMPGEYHGGDSMTEFSKGYATLAFQRWDDPKEMSSAAIQWKGELQGPVQENLIKSNKPDALVSPGYADISIPSQK